jgi:hypothetical protein
MDYRRYQTKTLVKWLRELNGWRWPDSIPDPEDRNAPGTPRRKEHKREIEHVLAWRMVQLVETGAV